MLVDKHGRAKVLTPEEITQLFGEEGFTTTRDRALFGICLYTACRINEACSLRVNDVWRCKGAVNPYIVFRKATTKNRLATRVIPVNDELRRLLMEYYPSPRGWWAFNGRNNEGHLMPKSASLVYKKVADRLGIIGSSTHSFRRTALTQMSNSLIPLRVIQEISGHRSLQELQKYLEVTDEQIKGAVASLNMLSHGKVSSYLLDFPDSVHSTLPVPDLSTSRTHLI